MFRAFARVEQSPLPTSALSAGVLCWRFCRSDTMENSPWGLASFAARGFEDQPPDSVRRSFVPCITEYYSLMCITTTCVSILPLADIWAIYPLSICGWEHLAKALECLFSAIWGIYPRMELLWCLLWHMLTVFNRVTVTLFFPCSLLTQLWIFLFAIYITS